MDYVIGHVNHPVRVKLVLGLVDMPNEKNMLLTTKLTYLLKLMIAREFIKEYEFLRRREVEYSYALLDVIENARKALVECGYVVTPEYIFTKLIRSNAKIVTEDVLDIIEDILTNVCRLDTNTAKLVVAASDNVDPKLLGRCLNRIQRELQFCLQNN